MSSPIQFPLPRHTPYNKISLAAGLAGGLILAGLSSFAADDTFTPGQIFEKVQENYNALSSYSDEGQVIAVMDDTVTTTQFTIRLARANFYSIEWWQYSKSSKASENSGPFAVWSSGAGDFLELGWGEQGPCGRDIALANAAASSGGAAGTIPEVFFDMQDLRVGPASDETRQADDKLGDIDCYVVLRKLPDGQTKTFWIGKQDFLIHQVQTVISTEAMQAAAANSNINPQLIHLFRGYTST